MHQNMVFHVSFFEIDRFGREGQTKCKMTSKKETPKEELKTSKIIANSFINYSKYTKIHGIVYVFKSNLSHLRKGFWISVLMLMLVTAAMWSTNVYQGWKDQPVLTTLASTAFPLNLVEFPAWEPTLLVQCLY